MEVKSGANDADLILMCHPNLLPQHYNKQHAMPDARGEIRIMYYTEQGKDYFWVFPVENPPDWYTLLKDKGRI
jgi:hypothetical protein